MSQSNFGGFDRRTLMAFGLMILVWILFTQFFMPKPAPRGTAATGEPAPAEPAPSERVESPAPAGRTARPPSGAEGTVASAGAATPAEGAWWLENDLPAEEREIVVQGDRFRAVFSARGAQLRSWALEGFTDSHGEPVDLVSPQGPGALGLRVEGGGRAIWLEETLFRLEEDSSGNRGERRLRFVAEGLLVQEGGGAGAAIEEEAARVRVERIYTLDRARYDFGMEVIVQGIANPRQDQQLVLAWEDGIPSLETQRDLDRRAKAAVVQLAESFIKDGYGGSGFGCQCGGGRAEQGGERIYQGMLRWAGVRGKYFAGLLIPEEEREATVVAHSEPQVGEVGLRVVQPLAFDGRTVQRYTVYAGPIDYRVLRELDQRVGGGATRIVDFGGSLIAPISKATHWFMVTAAKVVPNYGLVIFLLAAAVRLIFHTRSTSRRCNRSASCRR